MQITYNSGQLFSEKYSKYNTDERKQYYEDNKLNSYLVIKGIEVYFDLSCSLIFS